MNRRVLVALLGGAALLYVLVCAFYFFAQGKMIFPAPAGARTLPAAGTVVRGDGFRALDAPLPGGRGTVVLFHGNGEDLADAAAMIDLWRELRFSVFAVEYPGYGIARDLGAPSRDAIYASAERALSWVRERRPGLLVVQGQSLGSAVAAEMARRGFGSRLVLLAPLTSLAEVAQRVVPWLPARLLLRERFDTSAIAGEVRQPVLIVHGTADEVLPVEMAKRLSREFPHAELHLIPGAHHNDLLSSYLPALRSALSTAF
ncbi:MAG TPA: alpha/beta hydrolase [Myxococcales bacterium]|nr:alpha/beta hydrolase [Myxococcales bacterium]